LVLLIDNYDSFTYNLYDYILQLGFQCKVIRNDEYTIDQIERIKFDSIVLSPGPGKPQESGVTMEVIERFHKKKPILGICLGHQAIGLYFGAELCKAKLPMHGKIAEIQINNSKRLFGQLNNRLEVMRYHSLILEKVCSPLKTVAATIEGEIMAIEHETLPIAGVQFHPESILTIEGLQILKNWFHSIA